MQFYQLPEPKYSNDLIFAIEPGTPIEHQKAMSMGAFLAWSNNLPVNALYQPDKPTDASGLVDSWGVDDTDSALEVLEWLLNEGHRTHWKDTLTVFQGSKNIDNTRAIEFSSNLNDAISRLLHYKIIKKTDDLINFKIDAWDYGRVVLVASKSFYLGYLTQDQAMNAILRAFEQMIKVYPTWTEYARSYILGRLVWGGSIEATYDFVMVMMAMLEYDYSTWNRYPLDPFYQKKYHQEKQELLEQKIQPFKYKREVEKIEAAPESSVKARSQAEHTARGGFLSRLLSLPVIGHFAGLFIAVLLPFLAMLLIMPILKATLGDQFMQGRSGSNFFGFIYFSLMFASLYLIEFISQHRIMLPIIPIPLKWVSAFFAIIGLMAMFF